MSLLTLVSLWSSHRFQRRGKLDRGAVLCTSTVLLLLPLLLLCGFFSPSKAFDRHSRAGALTPTDRSCLQYITRVMADMKFTSKQQRTLFESLWIGRRRREAARGGSCRRLQKLAALQFGTAGFQLLVQAVISTPSIQCQNVLYVCCLSVLPALRQSSYHPFFFSVFFCLFFFTCCCCCHCLCIYPPSVHTSLLFAPLSLHTVLLFLFGKAQFRTNSRFHFIPTDATRSEKT